MGKACMGKNTHPCLVPLLGSRKAASIYLVLIKEDHPPKYAHAVCIQLNPSLPFLSLSFELYSSNAQSSEITPGLVLWEPCAIKVQTQVGA